MTHPSDPGKPIRATIAPLPDERRRKRRSRVSTPVRVRPSEPIPNGFDEVRVTINICRDGLYFDTDHQGYRKGLRLFITLPFEEGPNAMSLEYIGEVVRVDRLPDGRHGVAVHLKMTVNLHGGTSPVKPLIS